MAKRKKLKKVLLILLSLLLLAFAGWGGYELFKPKPYSVYGTVLVDGMPVEGLTVNSTAVSTVTDENGKFKIGGIYGSITVSLDNDQYYFKNSSITRSSAGECNFSGISYREVSGQVVSGSTFVTSAKLKITAENGEYVTYSDSEGRFYLDMIAGEVSIVATKDEMQFFSTTISKDENFAVVNGTTLATFNFSFDHVIDNDLTIKIDGNEIAYNKSEKFVVDNIKKDSLIEISSNNYYVENGKFTILEENGEFDINCFAKYDVEGNVVSGSEKIANADVYLDGEKIAQTDNEGRFVLAGLHGNNDIVIKKSGFNDFSARTTLSNKTVEAIMTFNVKGTVVCDLLPVENVNVKVGESVVLTNTAGKFEISSQLGEQISFSKNGYYFDNTYVVSVDNAKINVTAQEYYNIDFCVLNNENAVPFDLIIDGNRVSVENNFSLYTYKSHVIEIICDGYELETYNRVVDKNNNFSTVLAKKLYNVSATVRSGDLKLNGKVTYQNKTIDFVGGNIVLEKVYENSLIKIECDGYDSFQTVVNADGNIDVNLSYSITINARSGDCKVGDFTATINGKTVDVEDALIVSDLYGETEIEFSKENYTFEKLKVNNGGEYLVNATYKIFGVANKDGALLEGFKIILISNDGEIQTRFTDKDGKFEFYGLCGSYVLFSQNSNNVALKPDYYSVEGAGEYNFSNNGYNVSGFVKVGESPLKNVKITAGDKTTYTDENGYYLFSLLSSDCVLTFEKQGYVFDKNNVKVYEKDGDLEVCANATYEVQGKIISGQTSIPDVLVSCGEHSVYTDVDGNFSISGIATEGAMISFEKDGFEINSIVVNGYAQLLVIAYVKMDFSFKTGEIEIQDVLVSNADVNKLQIGDVVTFEKEGYSFESYTITNPTSATILSAYGIVGYVNSGNLVVSNVDVFVDGVEIAKTDDNGKFEILNVVGKQTISLAKDGYQISSIEVERPTELKVVASYSVSMRIKCGVYAVEGVCVKAGEVVAYTDNLGEVTLEGLYGENTITTLKDGYDFSKTAAVTSPQSIDVKSSYSVKGRVTVSGKGLEGVVVNLGLNGVETDVNGAFEFSGIEGFYILSVAQNGYSQYSCEINSPQELDISLGYQVVITFSGISSFEGINVLKDGKAFKTINEQDIILGYFEEEVQLTFEKENVKFNPGIITVSRYGEYVVNCVLSYKVSGTVLTESGLAVKNMKISAGKYSTYTDANGKYEIKGLEGKVQINGAFEGITHNGALTPKITEGEGVFDFTISDLAYGWALYESGYRYLDIASSYEIYGSGSVNPSVGGAQKVKSVNKKDTNGNILLENLNYGGEVAGVDPKVGLATFYNSADESVKYKKVGGSNVSSSLVADYSTTDWTNTTVNGYITTFGVNVKTVLPYTINDNTLSSVSIAKTDDGGYAMTMKLSTASETWSNYALHMTQLSGQTPKSFSYIDLYFNFNENGFITNLNVKEKYTVNVVIDVNITANLIYEYVLPSLDYSISDIVVDTEEDLQNSLKKGV